MKAQIISPSHKWFPKPLNTVIFLFLCLALALPLWQIIKLLTRTIFYFVMTRRLIFCLITIIISLAVHDSAFEARSLTYIRRILEVRNLGPIKYTQRRWK